MRRTWLLCQHLCQDSLQPHFFKESGPISCHSAVQMHMLSNVLRLARTLAPMYAAYWRFSPANTCKKISLWIAAHKLQCTLSHDPIFSALCTDHMKKKVTGWLRKLWHNYRFSCRLKNSTDIHRQFCSDPAATAATNYLNSPKVSNPQICVPPMLMFGSPQSKCPEYKYSHRSTWIANYFQLSCLPMIRVLVSCQKDLFFSYICCPDTSASKYPSVYRYLHPPPPCIYKYRLSC